MRDEARVITQEFRFMQKEIEIIVPSINRLETTISASFISAMKLSEPKSHLEKRLRRASLLSGVEKRWTTDLDCGGEFSGHILTQGAGR